MQNRSTLTQAQAQAPNSRLHQHLCHSARGLPEAATFEFRPQLPPTLARMSGCQLASCPASTRRAVASTRRMMAEPSCGQQQATRHNQVG